MEVSFTDSLQGIPAAAWDALAGPANPFLRHAFLHTLEALECVGPGTGWQPHHLLIRDGERLIGAVPLYLKSHSWGEFVFDWSWAEAYQRCGLDYYPKLVAAVPFSPVTGPRLLALPEADPEALRVVAAEAAQQEAHRLGASSVHWLFPPATEADALRELGYLQRHGVQFHWQNQGYPDFDAFLGALTAKKRKNIRRERRQVAESGLRFALLDGHRACSADWAAFEGFYRSTFYAYGNPPALRPGFFAAVARTMPEAVLLILALDGDEPVAGAFCLRGEDSLYGRYWGCRREVPGLHFETCYYQGLEYCIEHGLSRFEPGAQGEHKLPRGFLPTRTYSAHWLAESALREPVDDFLVRERRMVDHYLQDALQHSPFREPVPSAQPPSR